MLLPCLLLTGCQQARPSGLKSLVTGRSPLPTYSEIVLNYETTDFRSLASRLHPANVSDNLSSKIQQVSVVESGKTEPNALSGDWSQARIQIVYPHPDGSVDKGLARLVVTRKSPFNQETLSRSERLKNNVAKFALKASGASEEFVELKTNSKSGGVQSDEEIWQLDLPKEELDILISELSHRGFFEKQERPRGDALVTIKLDEGALSKRWTTEPRLEGLMLQVYNEGELTAFNTRPSRITPVSFQPKAVVGG